MGLLDRFRRRRREFDADDHSTEEADGGDGRWSFDWAADGLDADAALVAEELATSADFDVEECGEDGFDWEVSLFDDVRGLVGDDAIENLPAWLDGFDDVAEVVHADREIMWVAGRVSRAVLARRVVAQLARTADRDYWNRAEARDGAADDALPAAPAPRFDDFSKAEAQAYCDAYAASLPDRLRHLLSMIDATGGLSGELDGSPESLDALEHWVAAQRPDIGASRAGVDDLPLWADLDRSTRDWGPRLLAITDGVIAYWAHCYENQWPDTYWRVHDGGASDVDYRQPILWIDGGRGRVNLRHIVRNCIDAVLFDRDEPGTFRRVWQIWSPREPTS